MSSRLILMISLILLSLNSALATAAEKGRSHYLILGGSGNSNNLSEQFAESGFDDEIKPVLQFLEKAPYEVHFAFSGDYPYFKTEFPTIFSKNRIDGTAQNISQLIKSYITRLQKGEVTQGDKIVVHIIDHGSLKKKTELTHSIEIFHFPETTELQISLDALKELAQVAEKKGVLLTIIDSSCFSGATLVLANSKTCVVTGSTEDMSSHLTYVSLISAMIHSGQSVEETFLKSRYQYSALDVVGNKRNYVIDGNPQISSPAGQKLFRSLHDFTYYQTISNDVKSLVEIHFKDGNGNHPSLRLPDLSALFDSIDKNHLLDPSELLTLKEATQKYASLYNPLAQSLVQILNYENKSLQIDKKQIPWTQLKSQESNHKKSIENLQKELASGRPNPFHIPREKRELLLSQLSSELQLIQEALGSPDYEEYVSLKKESAKMLSDFENDKSTFVIAELEKKIYLAYYRLLQNTPGANPCKDFIF